MFLTKDLNATMTKRWKWFWVMILIIAIIMFYLMTPRAAMKQKNTF